MYFIKGQERQDCNAEMLKVCAPWVTTEMRSTRYQSQMQMRSHLLAKTPQSMFDDIMEAEVTPTLFIKSQVEADIDSYLKGIP